MNRQLEKTNKQKKTKSLTGIWTPTVAASPTTFAHIALDARKKLIKFDLLKLANSTLPF